MVVLPSPCDRKSLGKAEPLAALGGRRSLQPLGGLSKDIWVSKGFMVEPSKDNELSPACFVGFRSGRLGQESLAECISVEQSPVRWWVQAVMVPVVTSVHPLTSLCLRSRSQRCWCCACREPCVQQLQAGSMPVKPSVETQGETAGHKSVGKEAWIQPVASP